MNACESWRLSQTTVSSRVRKYAAGPRFSDPPCAETIAVSPSRIFEARQTIIVYDDIPRWTVDARDAGPVIDQPGDRPASAGVLFGDIHQPRSVFYYGVINQPAVAEG